MSMTSGLSALLCEHFAGKVVRKDLTKMIKEGANVPTYVLEYLLGMYCATDDEASIAEGIERVKSILAENFVRPDEAEKIKSKIREIGSFTVIDKLEARLDPEHDNYKCVFSNLNIKNVVIADSYVKKFEKLLSGGIWCILRMSYSRLEDRYDDEESAPIGFNANFDKPKGGKPKGKKDRISPFEIDELTPIQLPNMDMDELFEGRGHFTKDEWIDVLVRSSGLEPTQMETRVKWHILERMVPLVENNYNLCELGPRGTGKSHIYKEMSPNSILISGGQTTVANLFYNMSNRTIGLVGMWDCVAFDEVAGITFKDKDGIQIMKDFMASGSFARGKEEKNASASMVFVGNINQSVDALLKTSHLFDPFPEAMAYDSAFFDRMHYYLPGWEIPKMRPELITDEYGFITDYIAEFMREMRKRSFSNAIDAHFRLGSNLNQRDVIAVRKTVSGLLKLIYPNGKFGRDDVAEVLEYALEGRRRVKEQLKKIGGMEFYDVHFSYLENDTFEEHFVSVPEQGAGKLIPEGQGKPGHIYTVARGDSGMIGVFKLETEAVSGNGKFETTGIGSDREARESLKTAQNYFKANRKQISGTISLDESDYLMHVSDCQGIGVTGELALCGFVALCSAALRKPIQSQMTVLGNMSIGGTINKVEELANTLQVCFDAGAKRVLLPMSAAADIATAPPELFAKFQTSFYTSPEDAVYKALGIE
jgi:ATP-dependent Lon protease